MDLRFQTGSACSTSTTFSGRSAMDRICWLAKARYTVSCSSAKAQMAGRWQRASPGCGSREITSILLNDKHPEVHAGLTVILTLLSLYGFHYPIVLKEDALKRIEAELDRRVRVVPTVPDHYMNSNRFLGWLPVRAILSQHRIGPQSLFERLGILGEIVAAFAGTIGGV